MTAWKSTEDIPDDLGSTVVSIGKFDGVHLGHRSLLEFAVAQAKELDLPSVVLTFDRNPKDVLTPGTHHGAITGPLQRSELFRDLGISNTLELAFDEKLAALTPENFVARYLVDVLRASLVVVGQDFRFGSAGSGTVVTLSELGEQHGFNVETVAPVNRGGRKISSSWIRELLDAGNVVEASKLLGRNHRVTGVVEHGLKIGRKIGFPTANLSRSSEGYLPLDGVYSGWLHSEGQRYPAAISIGINETFQAVPRLLEAHVPDRDDLDFYDLQVEVEFIDFIRPTAKFDGIESLTTAIRADLAAVKKSLAKVN